MVFSNPINIATATMEDIYERLCWLYATVSQHLYATVLATPTHSQISLSYPGHRSCILSSSLISLIMSRIQSYVISERKIFYAPSAIGSAVAEILLIWLIITTVKDMKCSLASREYLSRHRASGYRHGSHTQHTVLPLQHIPPRGNPSLALIGPRTHRRL